MCDVFISGPENVIAVWSRVIDDLINIIFKMVHIVNCVVNSSSPEGHLPSDFQSDFEFFISENCFRELRDQCEKLGKLEIYNISLSKWKFRHCWKIEMKSLR